MAYPGLHLPDPLTCAPRDWQEVFVDPAGSNHWYKELEINAINTVWNLMLSKPYMDGGDEHSGRIATEGEPRYYEAVAQRTATRVLSGQLGDSGGATW